MKHNFYKIRKSKPSPLIPELLKFAAVGSLGLIINLAVLYALTEFLGLYYLISAVFAFFLAAFSNFTLNKIWTFGENIADRAAVKYAQFMAVSIFALLINLLLLFLLTELVGMHYLLSQIIATGLAFAVNFFGNKFWTFRKGGRNI